MWEIVQATLFTALGVIVKSMWDQRQAGLAERRTQAREARIRHLEAQLKLFYWPVYMRLMRDNALWPHLERRSGSDMEKANLGRALEREVVLPNHAALLQIIEANLHLAAGDEAVLEQVKRYVRHVAVFQALRAAGLSHQDPIAHDEPWPGNLFPTIEQRTREIQEEYNGLLAEAKA